MIIAAVIILLSKAADIPFFTDGLAVPRSALLAGSWVLVAGAAVAIAVSLARLRQKRPAAAHLIFSAVLCVSAVVFLLFNYGYVAPAGECVLPCF